MTGKLNAKVKSKDAQAQLKIEKGTDGAKGQTMVFIFSFVILAFGF